MKNTALRPSPRSELIVLAPTRELVVQVCEEAARLSPSRHCRTVAIFGGQRFGTQLSALKRGANLVVGTPGRVLDHLSRGTLSLAHVRYAVLDEADRMLDIGFRPDIEKILRRVTESISGRGLVILVSDFLVDREPLQRGLLLCETP